MQSRETELVYWRKGLSRINFGEHFAYLIPHLVFKVGFTYKSTNGFMTIGSELHRGFKRKHDNIVVWGAGNGYGPEHVLDDLTGWDIRAVRDTTTRDALKLDVPVGDPLFLANEVWSKSDQPKGVLFSPHWSTRRAVSLRKMKSSVQGIDDIFNVVVKKVDIHKRIRQLQSAEFVLTEALHVFLFCVALDIPCAPFFLAERNKPFKWDCMEKDLGVPLQGVAGLDDGRKWWERYHREIKRPDIEALKEAFPYE